MKSMLDDFGRVFFMDDKVYRGINPEQMEYCTKLLTSPLFRELDEKGLIPKTHPSEFSTTDYQLVLEHEKLLEILQHEWTFDMLKDASLLILEVNNICNKHGYELKDAHTLNILFRGTTPVFVDIGSIIPKITSSEDTWFAYDEFLCSFFIPLLFWSKGFVYITRKLLESHFYRMSTIPSQTMAESGLLNLLPGFKMNYDLTVRGKVLLTRSTDSGVLRNISARKLAEANVRASEDRYRNLFDSIDEGFCTIEMIYDRSEERRVGKECS